MGLFGMQRGVSTSFLIDLFEKTPPGQRLVIYHYGKMFAVESVTWSQCRVRPLTEALALADEETIDPVVSNYWYMPMPNHRLELVPIEAEADDEE